MRIYVCLFSFVVAMHADTIFLQGDSSFNAKVTYDSGRFKVKARVQGQPPQKPIPDIPESLVKTVRVNDEDNNVGELPEIPVPRGGISLGQPKPFRWEARTKDQKTITGSLETIDADTVKITGQKINRSEVVSLRNLGQ